MDAELFIREALASVLTGSPFEVPRDHGRIRGELLLSKK
jgi:hypothetical protein